MKKVLCVTALIVLCGIVAISASKLMPMEENSDCAEYALYSRRQLMVEMLIEMKETNALLRKIVRFHK